ncbi:MAG: ATP-binding protein, partial [Coriobacteriales bacterium]|nr:ATP-binding protein [Coriobacteriales bacterium]
GVLSALRELMLVDSRDELLRSRAYGEFAYRFFASGASDLCAYVLQLATGDDNPYARALCAGIEPAAALAAAVESDLRNLQTLCEFSPNQLKGDFAGRYLLPDVPMAAQVNLPAAYHERMRNVRKLGLGIYARNTMFVLADDGTISPVSHPDPVTLRDLVGYEREKQLIIQNTQALLEGKPAANMLLTGDAGTGKSSTVKAVVNKLAAEGLRILELRKDQLHLIPALLDELTANPLCFILFIDDLSFSHNSDDYAALKAVLEGSVSAKSPNVVVYATSNRRHLVKESFSERDGDDVHRNDTIQEIVSLSERFGIRVTFSKPNKETYLAIVSQLVRDRGMEFDADKLALAAERYALRSGGRSARRARQFVDALVSGSQTVE